MLAEWGAASLWLLFGHSCLSRCIDHRQGVAEGGQAGNMRWGYSGGDGYRGKVRAHCILSLHVDSKQEGGWSLEREKEKELEWVGFCPCSLALCSQPCSCARWSNERPGASDKLRPDGKRTITLQQRALEPVQLLLYGEKIITGFFSRILNRHCFTTHCTVWRISAVVSSSIPEHSILEYCNVLVGLTEGMIHGTLSSEYMKKPLSGHWCS